MYVLIDSLSLSLSLSVSIGILVGYVRFLTAQCRDWLRNVVNFLIFRSQASIWSTRRGFIQVFTQDYEGRENDVTIMPWKGHISPINALFSAIKNPTNIEFFDVVYAAQRNTFPSLGQIKAHCLIERTLDNCVQRLRHRIAQEEAESMSIGRTQSRAQEEGNYLTVNSSTAFGGLKGRKAGGLKDRTPSFYTTRSIVNLSGLSVADPLPHVQPIQHTTSTEKRRGSFKAQKGKKLLVTL